MSQYTQESAGIEIDDSEQRKRIRTERIRKQEAERKRKHRASESPGSHQARLEDQRSRTATLRANETPNTTQSRRSQDSAYHRTRRDGQREERLLLRTAQLQQAEGVHRLAIARHRSLQPGQRILQLIGRRNGPSHVPQGNILGQLPRAEPAVNELDLYPQFFEENQADLERLRQLHADRQIRQSQQRSIRDSLRDENGRLPPRTFTPEERRIARLQDEAINDLVRRLTPPPLRHMEIQARQDVESARLQVSRERFLHTNRLYRVACTSSLDEFIEDGVGLHSLGNMDSRCAFCGAFYFKSEETTKGVYTTCCSSGQIQLPPFQPPTQFVKDLLLGRGELGKEFSKNPRRYNTLTSFASITMDEHQFPVTGVPSLRIHGQIYHRLGSILPSEGSRPLFMQCFFYTNSDNELFQHEDQTSRLIIRGIMEDLGNVNPFIRSLRNHLTSMQSNNLQHYRLELSDVTKSTDAHERQYNAPCTTEVAAIIVGHCLLMMIYLLIRSRFRTNIFYNMKIWLIMFIQICTWEFRWTLLLELY
jgi:hypothetical protein